MKSILVALLIVILAFSFHYLKKKTDLLDGIFPARSGHTQKKTPRKSPLPKKKPEDRPSAPRKINPVRIRERKNGMVYYSVTCPHCQKKDHALKQTREPLPGMNKMETYRCPACSKTTKIYIQ